MSVEDEDITDTPRSDREIEEALRIITSEMIYNPTVKSKAGPPLLITYVTVRDALKELLMRREIERRVEKPKGQK